MNLPNTRLQYDTFLLRFVKTYWTICITNHSMPNTMVTIIPKVSFCSFLPLYQSSQEETYYQIVEFPHSVSKVGYIGTQLCELQLSGLFCSCNG